MTARTWITDVIRKEWIIQMFPMIADEIIYKGSTVLINTSTGYAFTNDGTAHTLSVGDIFAGIAIETVDSTGIVAGGTYVRVYTDGHFLLTFSDTLTQANVGDRVFINNVTDDSVVTITQDTGNAEIYIGTIVEFVSATTAYVSLQIGDIGDTSPGNASIPAASIANSKLASTARWSLKVGITGNLVGDVSFKDTGKIGIWDGTDYLPVAVTWDVTINASWVTAIGASKVTNTMMADDAIKQAEMDYEVATVSIVGAASWTATVTTGWQIIGYYETAFTGTERVKTVDVSWTTLTVTLSWSDTATVKVVLLKA